MLQHSKTACAAGDDGGLSYLVGGRARGLFLHGTTERFGSYLRLLTGTRSVGAPRSGPYTCVQRAASMEIVRVVLCGLMGMETNALDPIPRPGDCTPGDYL